MDALRVGTKVCIPWGFARWADGEVVEVWGDAAAHIRVQLQLDGDEEPVILLTKRSAVQIA